MTRIVPFLAVFFTSLTNIFSAPPKTDEFPLPQQQYPSIPPYFPAPSYHPALDFQSPVIASSNKTVASRRAALSPTNTSSLGPILNVSKPLLPLIPFLPIMVPYRTELPQKKAESRKTRLPTKTTPSLRTRPSTKITASSGMRWRNLEKFVEALEANCSFDRLDEVYKDLKNLWAEVVKGRTDRNQSKMDHLQGFPKNLLEQYNKCAEKRLILDLDRRWEIYRKIFGKKYIEKEKAIRKAIFKRSVDDMMKHNELYKRGLTSYTATLNQFSDWTEEELNELNGLRVSPNASSLHGRQKRMKGFPEAAARLPYDNNPLPDSFVWGTDYVTPVKHQGKCASCYAFAGNGALEAYHKKRTGELVELSAQNILDCTWHLGNNGCKGGRVFSVFDYAIKEGVVPDSRYPYTMNASRNCRWKRKHATAKDRGYYVIPQGNEEALQHAVANHGPVAVGIGTKGIYQYGSGVFHTSDCGPPDHAVLVIGYGTDPRAGDYWIVKNCWGFNWGDGGYVRIARNRNNMCHIASHAYFPF